MDEKNTAVCSKCGSEFVPACKELKSDGSLQMDGTWNFNSQVCPRCHPELVAH